jgi:hypothetical protein
MKVRSLFRRPLRRSPELVWGLAAGVVALAAAIAPALDRAGAARMALRRVDDLTNAVAGQPDLARVWARDIANLGLDVAPIAEVAGDLGALASWQTIGGCGAGAAGGSGVGIKWIGRNASGGLFHLELQGNYVQEPYGHDWVGVTLITKDVSEKWNLGVSVPYLYKFINDPYGLQVDVANKGPGDVNLMVTRRFGAINDTIAMAAVGVPTGTHDAKFRGTEVLQQERQLGLGKPTASLMIDHIMDNLWGPAVLGGTVAYRGGENELQNYRAATASLYGYVCYLMGPFAPAIGMSVSGWQDHDRDSGGIQRTPLFNVAGNASIEYSADWIAVLLGASLPYQYTGFDQDQNGRPQSPWSVGQWIFGLGVALAPF